ncbi:MAG TPA: glycoside hydrolase family 20 zincin-like fold domain-containing protein, partial [Candidatus Tumulicola sp.]
MLRWKCAGIVVALGLALVSPTASAEALRLLPAPVDAQRLSCTVSARSLTRVPQNLDPGAYDELQSRWSALGVGSLTSVSPPQAAIGFVRDSSLAPQAYRLTVDGGRATVASSDSDGAFYGVVTLSQMAMRSENGAWIVPCARIEDRPKLQWRVLSDDVSRGPLPTMRYFLERIRTIAAFKMNGYSPYMEHVFVDPRNPLPAPLDGITPAQLHELTAYAKHYHVTFIPEQQTFAHMHGTLQFEKHATAAEFQQHDFLLSPASP